MVSGNNGSMHSNRERYIFAHVDDVKAIILK